MPAGTVTDPPGTTTGPITISTPETLLASGGPSVTTITSGAGTNGETVNITADNVQVGNLSGEGFTINDTVSGGVAVQMLGSYGTLEGNVLSSAGGQGADVVTGSSADNLLIDGNTFGGTGFALAYVNGALDTYTASTNVDIENNTFTGVATAGTDISDDAASGTISGNTFSGSGNQAIFLGGISAATAAYYNNLYGTTYVSVPGSVTVSNNTFKHWTGADISTMDASYTFANGGGGHTLTETITASGQEIDTLSGFQTYDHITLDSGFDTALGVHQNGSTEVDVYLSTGDELVIQGSSVGAYAIGTMLGVAHPGDDYIPLPASDSGSAGNVNALGQVGGSGPTEVDASQVSYVSFSVGDGADLIIAGNNNAITLGAGRDTVTGGSNDTITLGSASDTVTLTGSGNTVNAGTGAGSVSAAGSDNTFVAGAGTKIAISNGHWVASVNGHNITLSGIDKVVIGGQTYDLVDKFGAGTGGFQSLQAAIDAGSNGDTVLVAPGTYTESANYNPNNNTDDPNVTNPVGLLINKSVTIEGVNSQGKVITSASGTQATIVSSIESDFGTNFLVTAAGVTVTGLNFQATDNEYGQSPENQGVVNKAIEVTANGFSLANSQVTAASGVPLASSVYVDESNVPANLSGYVADISSFDIAHNILTGDFVEANGVGYGDATTNLQLTSNEFSLNAGTTADTYASALGGFAPVGVILDGQVPGTPWLAAPVALPNATGNTMDANYTESPTGGRFFYIDQNGVDAPTLAYVQNYVAANHFPTYAYALNSGGAPDIPFSYGAYSYQIYINVGDATAPAGPFGPDGSSSGDTVVVQSGTDNSVQTVGTDDLTIEALKGSTALDLSLGSGVSSIALADYSAGKGANVTVTGTGSSESITGNDGNDTLTAGASSTISGGSGNNSLSVGDGTSTNNSSITAGAGKDTVTAGAYTNVSLGNGNDSVSLTSNDTISAIGHGIDTISASGADDQIALSGGHETISLINTATDATLVDATPVYHDTVVGFNEDAGDTISLSGRDTTSYALTHASLVNGGQDTQITLNDGSTILLKGVMHINSGAFGAFAV